MSRLNNKVAVITGAAGGIGASTAKLFVDEGASVVMADLEEEAIRKAAEEQGISDKVVICAGDVTSPDDNVEFVKAAEEAFGGLDIFLANAGIEGVVKPLTEYPIDTFDKVLNVNVKGAFLGIRAAMPAMQKRGGGSIILTSSVAGLQGTGQVCAYTTSKHAVIGLMRDASKEGAPAGIRVNTVNPSPVENRMMRSLEEGFAPGKGEEMHETFKTMIPMQRYAENEEIANMMLFLASDESSFVTGQVHAVDGGMTS